jgi:4-hydroxy-3-methylbut-2-enyl diphosphate reductase
VGGRALQITLAKTAGFCFGVDRAVNMLYSLVDEGKKVCTLGPIIHNPSVISDLESRGVRIIDNPSEADDGSLIVIRTHGVTKDMLDSINESKKEFCNATCPFVTKIHKIVSENSNENTVVLIAGDSSHPEVVGIRSYCKGKSYVFKNEKELEEILKNDAVFEKNDIILVSQTTFSINEWKKCEKKLKFLYTNAIIFDTICNATEERQKEADELSRANDAMIIVGGRTSSNTAKLKAVCEKNCPTFLIETASELESIDFSKFNSVGVTAGASTPDGVIKEVLSIMSEIKNEQTTEVKEEPISAVDGDTSFEAMLEENLEAMNSDQKVVGVVVGISATEIQLDIGRKQTGYLPFNEYSNDPTIDPRDEVKVGDEINLIIMKTNDVEGTITLSKKRYDAAKVWEDLAADEDKVYEGKVTDIVGDGKGLFVAANGFRAFIPASLAKANRNDSLEDMLKTDVKFRIIEVDKRRRRVVGSIRALLSDARREAREKFWAEAEVNQVYTGTVRSLTSYGAFVDLGGVDGMIHISELSWQRIKHPSEVVNVGDTVEVYIKALDKENKKVSLGYKKVEDNPWEIMKRDFPSAARLRLLLSVLQPSAHLLRLFPALTDLSIFHRFPIHV